MRQNTIGMVSGQTGRSARWFGSQLFPGTGVTLEAALAGGFLNRAGPGPARGRQAIPSMTGLRLNEYAAGRSGLTSGN